MSTGRAPSIDHIAISTAPVSDAGTIAILCVSGTPRIARVRSIASLSLALPGLARCERPRTAPSSALVVHPGRFLVGPEENRGSAGRTAGLAGVVINLSPILTDGRPPLGADGPLSVVRWFGPLVHWRPAIVGGHNRGTDKPTPRL